MCTFREWIKNHKSSAFRHKSHWSCLIPLFLISMKIFSEWFKIEINNMWRSWAGPVGSRRTGGGGGAELMPVPRSSFLWTLIKAVLVRTENFSGAGRFSSFNAVSPFFNFYWLGSFYVFIKKCVLIVTWNNWSCPFLTAWCAFKVTIFCFT